jgi:hypothetical protein
MRKGGMQDAIVWETKAVVSYESNVRVFVTTEEMKGSWMVKRNAGRRVEDCECAKD